MKIALINDDGEVMDECCFEDQVEQAREEFPRDTALTHKELAKEEMIEAARHMIRQYC